jgi:hypothetical protein
MKLSLVLLSAVALVSAAGPAAAQPEPPQKPSPESTAPERTWYGWQIMGTDAAAVAVLAAGLSIHNDSFHVCDTCDAERYLNPHSLVEASGVLLYLGGGLIVHIAHHQTRKGFRSLALRAAAPAGGAFVGLLLGGIIGASEPNPCAHSDGGSFAPCLGPGVGGAALGAAILGGIGLVVAPIIDHSMLAYADRPVVSRPAATAAGWQVVPNVAFPSDSAGRMTPSLGVSGVF